MENKLALVTGASSGIGYALAKELADRGYDLVVCSAGDRLTSAADNFAKQGVLVKEITADLATQEGVTELWNRVQEFGHPL